MCGEREGVAMRYSRTDTCKFIADHAAELAKLADDANLPVVSYIANMLRLQAETDAMTATKARRAA